MSCLYRISFHAVAGVGGSGLSLPISPRLHLFLGQYLYLLLNTRVQLGISCDIPSENHDLERVFQLRHAFRSLFSGTVRLLRCEHLQQQRY